MPTTHEPVALRQALQFLIESGIPSEHKRVLIETVTDALKNGQAEEGRVQALERPSREWQPHEIERATLFLTGRVARSWQHADEVVMRLASDFHRELGDVRRKATELGFAVAVDYRQARTHVVPPNTGTE